MTNGKKICIIGAGIGGLTAGALLIKQGFNVTIFENTSVYDLVGNNLADYIVQEQLAQGADFRFPPLNPEFTPGVMFRYEDNARREYFGWSNGLIIQLYDDEAILKSIVSLNSTIFEIDEVAQINVSVENIGSETLTDIQAKLSLIDKFGESMESIITSPFSINSGEEKTLQIDLDQNLLHGTYLLLLNITGVEPLLQHLNIFISHQGT